MIQTGCCKRTDKSIITQYRCSDSPSHSLRLIVPNCLFTHVCLLFSDSVSKCVYYSFVWAISLPICKMQLLNAVESNTNTVYTANCVIAYSQNNCTTISLFCDDDCRYVQCFLWINCHCRISANCNFMCHSDGWTWKSTLGVHSLFDITVILSYVVSREVAF